VSEAIPAELARRIRMVVFDVDGVLTDGGIYLGATESGEPVEMKRFDIQDGLGILMMKNAGLRVAIVTGRTSEAVRIRADELQVDDLHQDRTANKVTALTAILEKNGIAWEDTAFLGDDLPDIAVLRRLTCSSCSFPPSSPCSWCSTRPAVLLSMPG
jgi:3-deoxy-D-manno-octulosonate 8-phosphate phosphatase (KDO 8-P phosphatase)